MVPKQTTKNVSHALPDDVLTDLKHVMDLLRPEGESLPRAGLRTLMHNFGHYAIRQKEFEEELGKHGLDPRQPSFSDAEAISLITSLWFAYCIE